MMIEMLLNPEIFRWAGLLGSLIGLIGTLIPGLVYRGSQNEPYSFLNHFISELGEKGISKLAWVFNLSMILSGLCVVTASLSLGLILPGFWAKAGLLLGVITGLALALVGLFPMNDMKSHMRAAVTFFRAGLLMSLFFSLAILFQNGAISKLPRWFGLAGLGPVMAFAVFLGLMWKSRREEREALATDGVERPKVWNIAISEWLIFFSFIIWIFVIALGISG